MLDSLTIKLDQLDCLEQIVKDWKKIHKVFVKKLRNENVTTSEISEVETISIKCSDEYGDGVHIARIIMADYNNLYYDTNDDCRKTQTDPRSSKGNNIDNFDFQVYPNPSSGHINVSFENETSGDILLIALNGSIVEKMSVENKKEM